MVGELARVGFSAAPLPLQHKLLRLLGLRVRVRGRPGSCAARVRRWHRRAEDPHQRANAGSRSSAATRRGCASSPGQRAALRKKPARWARWADWAGWAGWASGVPCAAPRAAVSPQALSAPPRLTRAIDRGEDPHRNRLGSHPCRRQRLGHRRLVRVRGRGRGLRGRAVGLGLGVRARGWG